MVVCLSLACASPIRVKRVGAREVYAELTDSVLSSGRLSSATVVVLNRLGLEDAFRREPERVLLGLRRVLEDFATPETTVALAELSFAYAERSGDRRWYLASVIYAYAYLFPEDERLRTNPADPRLRLALDLYNRGVAEGLRHEDGIHLRIENATYDLPLGQLEVRIDESQLRWGPYRLTDFETAAELQVIGLRSRHRQRGIGVAAVAEARSDEMTETRALDARYLPEKTSVSVTAFLRLENIEEALTTKKLTGRLEVYALDRETETDVMGYRVPLEYELSSTLASSLDNSPLWSYSLAGFLRAEKRLFDERLIMLQPYRPDRIPVVLVHGTASSPATWAELLNELQSFKALRDRFQTWLFIYNTGVPVVLSANELRQTLEQVVAEIDPEGDDEMLRRMVLVGHSQGGLLVRLNVTKSGDRLWKLISDEPFDDVELRPRNREILRSGLFFEPLPFVERAVFMATPHHGSFLADRWLAGVAASLVRLPAESIDLLTDVFQGDPVMMRRLEQRSPSSIDGMKTDSPFLAAMRELPFGERVGLHSIIGVREEGPIEEGDDGVVKYTSAHFDGVESERVVRSGHSVQNNPVAILELGRILFEHAGLERIDMQKWEDALEILREMD